VSPLLSSPGHADKEAKFREHVTYFMPAPFHLTAHPSRAPAPPNVFPGTPIPLTGTTFLLEQTLRANRQTVLVLRFTGPGGKKFLYLVRLQAWSSVTHPRVFYRTAPSSTSTNPIWGRR
jgi:hypothetical protein